MNPIVTGWYADPEARFYEGRYWIYVTRSFTAYTDQMNLDAFSSTDLIHWDELDTALYPDELAELCENVSVEDVVAVANSVECDMIYFLTGSEDDEDEETEDAD